MARIGDVLMDVAEDDAGAKERIARDNHPPAKDRKELPDIRKVLLAHGFRRTVDDLMRIIERYKRYEIEADALAVRHARECEALRAVHRLCR